MPGDEPFDRQFYDRYYRRRATTVHSPQECARLGAFVCAYVAYLGHPVRRVLDIGCGLGFWRPIIAKYFPKAKYLGVEYSEYTCEKYGWTRGSVVDFVSRQPCDLVICQGVLQYLDNRAALAAMANLATLAPGILFFEALTREDWQRNCDRERTDGDVHLRPASWYRRRLAANFTNCGGGIFTHRDSGIVSWELEILPVSRR